ncbi:MAG: S41 family peptidase [Muribaculaceae bacterium]|nr:S41 family peptidase [Muribaculaceae bacterium]
MNKKYLSLIPVALCMALVCIGAPKSKPAKSHDMSFQQNLTLFNSLAKELEKNYVDSIRTEEAFKAAIDAMLNTIDPYTEFYNTDDKESINRLTTGSYGGIGAFVIHRNGDTYISEPVENAPAQKAGLKAGDKIIKIDSTYTHGMSVNEVTRMLKGEPSTSLSLTVSRPYTTDSILTFNITREKVQENSVPMYGTTSTFKHSNGKKTDGEIGYLSLTSFIDKSPEEVEEALLSFKEEPDLRGIILDLRGNGGGLVESAIEIIGNFIPKGTEVLRTRGKGNEKIYKTTHKPLFPDLPMVVIIDGGSASASEITAGSLQDLDRAVLIGSTSFGKGLVQGTYPLPFDALLKVTIAKYYIPSGRLIQALDYSHRNPDGTVARTPDSLTHVYKTLHGREVRDGGGLQPDSTLQWPKTRRIIYDLASQNVIFDYATKYAATHPAPEDVTDLTLTDADFEEFCAMVDTTDIKGSKVGLELIDKLRELAVNEGFDSEELSTRLDSVVPFFKPDLARDLKANKEEIMDFIGAEIASRYGYAEGRLAYSLINDPGVKAAVEILSDPALYKRLLQPKISSGKR